MVGGNFRPFISRAFSRIGARTNLPSRFTEMTTYPHEAASTAPPSYQNFSSTRERALISGRHGSNLYVLGIETFTNSISRTFNLCVEQQPLKSRMSGVGEKSKAHHILNSLTFRQPSSHWYLSDGLQTYCLDPPPAVSVTVLTNRDQPNSFLGL